MILKNPLVFTGDFVPETIKHREEEIQGLRHQIRFLLEGRQGGIKNTVIYGLSGTGKTLVVRLISSEVEAQKTKVYYIKLREAETEYRAISKIAEVIVNKDFKGHLSTTIYETIYKYLSQIDEKHILLILDEIDKIKQDCNILLDFCLRPYENYNLNGKNMAVFFISNKMTFPQNLDAGMKSSFSGVDKLVFPPYDAIQLRDILKERAEKGLVEGTYDDVTLSFCAAIGAQEHGDARRTIRLLGKAADVAEKNNSIQIEEKHIKQAIELIEFEGAAKVIKSMTTEQKAVALAITKEYKIQNKSKTSYEESRPNTKAVYDRYVAICQSIGITKLTQRRTTDIINEFEDMGLISLTLIYRGRGMGRTRLIEPQVPIEIIEREVMEDSRFDGLKRDTMQSRLG